MNLNTLIIIARSISPNMFHNIIRLVFSHNYVLYCTSCVCSNALGPGLQSYHYVNVYHSYHVYTVLLYWILTIKWYEIKLKKSISAKHNLSFLYNDPTYSSCLFFNTFSCLFCFFVFLGGGGGVFVLVMPLIIWRFFFAVFGWHKIPNVHHLYILCLSQIRISRRSIQVLFSLYSIVWTPHKSTFL